MRVVDRFSSLLSLGASLDLDFGELLDYFTFDAQTSDVLLYIEEVKNAPAFSVSGVRQISRMKPVIVLKGRSGRPAPRTRWHPRQRAGTT